jgi:hypothetical protein
VSCQCFRFSCIASANIYSHVAPEVETRLLEALQRRWTTALHTLTDTTPGNAPTHITRLALPTTTTPTIDLTAYPATTAAALPRRRRPLSYPTNITNIRLPQPACRDQSTR